MRWKLYNTLILKTYADFNGVWGSKYGAHIADDASDIKEFKMSEYVICFIGTLLMDSDRGFNVSKNILKA